MKMRPEALAAARTIAGSVAAIAMSAAVAGMSAASCTAIVEHELSSRSSDGGFVDAGPCDDLIFLDGTPNDGGQFFHAGVTSPSFRGPAFPRAGRGASNFGSALTFQRDGGLELVGGFDPDQVYFRAEEQWVASGAVPGPGHEGPASFGCAEIIAWSYDSLRDTTAFQLVAGGCGDDSVFYDGGTTTGTPGLQAPGLAWGSLPDGGGVVAAFLGGRVEACNETFPLQCFPPQAIAIPTSGERRVDSLLTSDGANAWIVSAGGSGEVRLYRSDFGASTVVAPFAGPVAAIAADIGIATRLSNGHLETRLFNSSGAPVGVAASFDLGDAAAHGLEISRIGTTPSLRATWLGGDGQARVATLDTSVGGAPRLTQARIICGSQGASFAAPVSSTTSVVLLGDALFLRHTP